MPPHTLRVQGLRSARRTDPSQAPPGPTVHLLQVHQDHQGRVSETTGDQLGETVHRLPGLLHAPQVLRLRGVGNHPFPVTGKGDAGCSFLPGEDLALAFVDARPKLVRKGWEYSLLVQSSQRYSQPALPRRRGRPSALREPLGLRRRDPTPLLGLPPQCSRPLSRLEHGGQQYGLSVLAGGRR